MLYQRLSLSRNRGQRQQHERGPGISWRSLACLAWLLADFGPGMEAAPLLAAAPEPEPQADADPLGSPTVIFLTADGEAGDLISFRTFALMLQRAELQGDSKVFVPPADVSEAQLVADLVDMEEVQEMDDDDCEELAHSLMEQLTPSTADSSRDNAVLAIEGVDSIDRACAACAPPIHETLFGHFRAPVELPPALAAAAEREIGTRFMLFDPQIPLSFGGLQRLNSNHQNRRDPGGPHRRAGGAAREARPGRARRRR